MVNLNVATTPGTLFTRSAIAYAAVRSQSAAEAVRLADRRWPHTPAIAEYVDKATSAATTTEDGVGAALVVPGTTEFLALVRARTVLGRLGRLRGVPFHESVAYATAGAVFTWVGEGAPTPVGRLTFTPASLPRRKVGGIVVLTDRLLKDSSPAAEAVIREELVGGAAAFMDTAFLSDTPAVTDVAPAGILNGATAVPSAGNPADDLKALLAGFTTLDGVTVILSELAAIAIGATIPGALAAGMLFGVVPFVASSAAGDRLIAVHAPRVLFADEGETEVDVARHASLEMSTEPTNDSATPAAAQMVSLWQTNTVGLKLTRYLNWEARSGAVRYIESADYAEVMS